MEVEKLRYLILAIQRQGERALAKHFKELGVTPSQAEALRIIQDAGSLSLKELGERLICETGSPSRLLTTLVNKKLVSSTVAETDKRIRKLTLTTKGKEVAVNIQHKEHLFYKEYAAMTSNISSDHDLAGALGVLVSDPQALRALSLRGFISPLNNNQRKNQPS